ncbi:MAG: Gfo/Idh/MocA family oxidoreductase [Treponema sp.]|nr:Gfo/Idh/MocA family oxidoreductase [Treponema sp.]
MSEPIKVAIAGLGSRGRQSYAVCQHRYPDLMKITAIADIDPLRVKEAAETFGISEDRCFKSGEEICNTKDLADVMFICTPDREHADLAILALRNDYHVLLEKPMAPTLEDCRRILDAANESNKKTIVCHVLRYTPFYMELKKVLESGEIGEIVSVQAMENVGYFHQAHSFVRGNWRNASLSSPMILQKCCHDMDLLLWLTDKKLKSVSSFGNLYLFKKENAPDGATHRCLDGCKAKETCPYDAEKIYITNERTGILHGNTGWPNDVLASNPNRENIRNAIDKGPYGRCVYHCDNDVPDHMVVNMLLEDGVSVAFTMTAFGLGSRHMHVFGTMGSVTADLSENKITIGKFGKPLRVIDIGALADDLKGHAGGDHRMIYDFLNLIKNGSGTAVTSIQNSSESHLACFAAEHSRLNGGILVDTRNFS